MKLVENVYEIAESFMENPEYVKLNYEKIRETAHVIKTFPRPEFPIPDSDVNVFKGIVLELVAASINYCYWYGKSSIRPNGSSSTTMYELLMNAFYDFEYPDSTKFTQCIERFIRLLCINRFPLVEDRVRHLRELNDYGLDFCIGIENRYNAGIINYDMNYFLNELVEKFPGFASDIFLKRASLFFIQLFRRFGWLKDELKNLHVPADYQIPKCLEYRGLIEYNDILQESISRNELIPKNSRQECEIRSATILTIKKLTKLTDWNVAEVDAFFFLQRKQINWPFHLTITTDY